MLYFRILLARMNDEMRSKYLHNDLISKSTNKSRGKLNLKQRKTIIDNRLKTNKLRIMMETNVRCPVFLCLRRHDIDLAPSFLLQLLKVQTLCEAI